MTTNENVSDRVLREDILLFLNAALSGNGQASFYRSKFAQELGLDFVHAYIRENYRRLYSLMLAIDINDHNALLLIRNLLATPLDADSVYSEPFRLIENELIAAKLQQIPPQRVYRFFSELRRRRINNRRTRATIKRYIETRDRQYFDAVKYRKGFKDACRHAHLSPPGEIGDFLFGWQHRRFKHPLLDAWRAAHYSENAIYSLPYSVAEGFAEKHGVPRRRFLNRIKGQMTKNEAERMTRTRASAGTSPINELDEMGLERLFAFYFAQPSRVDKKNRRFTIERKELLARVERAAAREFGRLKQDTDRDMRVALVLDNSYSSRGSRANLNRPLVLAHATEALFKQAFVDCHSFWTSSSDSLHVGPNGTTSLATPILNGLETRPDILIIVSDGWENELPGAANAVVELYRRNVASKPLIAMHINPVFDGVIFEPKKLGPAIPTLGARRVKDLFTMLSFVKFASGDANALALELELKAKAEDALAARKTNDDEK